MEIKEICPICGKLLILKGCDFKKEILSDDAGKHYTVMWYVCSCGHDTVVQIDDSETLEDLKALKNIVLKSMIKKRKKETISPKWEKKVDKLHNRINKKRESLKASLRGKKLVNSDKNIEIKV